jgi:hypothetical protein
MLLQPTGNDMDIELFSTLTCPHCGVATEEQMPEDACIVVYTCTGCGADLRPLAGHCCVFCSFATVPCPPVQGQPGGAPGSRQAAEQGPDGGS